MSNYNLTQLSIIRDNKVSRATITDLCGIDREIVDSLQWDLDAMEIPTFEKEWQVNFGKPEWTVQVMQTGMCQTYLFNNRSEFWRCKQHGKENKQSWGKELWSRKTNQPTSWSACRTRKSKIILKK